MPRKLPPPQAVAPVATLLPPPPPSPIIQTLRKDWRWAAISQFIWTFSDAFGLVDWDIEALEADFDGDEKALIPTLIAKLLFALTYNRLINRDNAFETLRRTYAKRRPDQRCLLGTEENPIEWGTLGLSQKVQILHELCEWQLEDPARFRGLLKSEEDAVSWRVEPVGWDKDGNAFWLFDDNRLWIQRIPPPPPPPPRPLKKSSQKAKKAARKSQSRPSTSTPSSTAPKKSHRKRQLTPELSLTPPPAAKEEDVLSGSRRRKSVNFYGNPTPTAQALKKAQNTPTEAPSSSRSTRNTRNNPLPESSQSPSKSKNTPLPLGTRVSRRLRNVDDEWQQVPDDWLTPSKSARGKGKGKAKKADGDGDESELSELTDEEEHERLLLASGAKKTNGKLLEGSKVNGNAVKDEENMDVDEKENGAIEVHTKGFEDEPSVVDGGEAAPVTVQLNDTIDTKLSSPSAGASDNTAPPEPASLAEDEFEDVGGATKGEQIPESDRPNGNSSGVQPAIDIYVSGGETPLVSGQAEETENSANGLDDSLKPNAEDVKTDLVQQADDDHAPAQIPELGDIETKEEPNAEPEIKVEKSDLMEKWEAERSHIPSDFVEWETVCVSLYEWRTFPEQYNKSKDPDEKALYILLTQQVGPTIIDVLIAKEQERIKQEAVNNRKRSSRIATRELEKEEILKREAAEREMEERMERIRSEETRKQHEEEEAISLQKAREDRLKEREERAMAREEALMKKAEDEIREREKRERKREKRKRRREGEEVSDDSDDEPTPAPKGRGSSTVEPVDTPERWELNCEVCKKIGWNIDEDLDLVCCDDCGRWQHTECHDRQDMREGRGKKNWDQVDFKCKECIHRAIRKKQRLSLSQLPQPQTNGHHQQSHPLSQSHPVSPYPIVPGSTPGPHAAPSVNPSRPPPPPLGPEEFYLPYPHPPANIDSPAGYAVYYPPNPPNQSPKSAQQGYQQQQQVQSRYPQGHLTPQTIPQHPLEYQISPPQGRYQPTAQVSPSQHPHIPTSAPQAVHAYHLQAGQQISPPQNRFSPGVHQAYPQSPNTVQSSHSRHHPQSELPLAQNGFSPQARPEPYHPASIHSRTQPNGTPQPQNGHVNGLPTPESSVAAQRPAGYSS
ncbi:uncharacterized protein I206_102243 [Kwoniella pini CBS 10737]|uniref:PHD-type domain-containing protein n=1 Tax=Kwoniella pini CBS 10737 TaxID=1296096 RepID=A0A1B9HSX9_9TREE|nr:uncharacterized protein I206_07613 [Kwoniella pini CBS 10737]OCF46379.1 hypothetical protein I206_07613 [Kwoniella pini CBS 10737]